MSKRTSAAILKIGGKELVVSGHPSVCKNTKKNTNDNNENSIDTSSDFFFMSKGYLIQLDNTITQLHVAKISTTGVIIKRSFLLCEIPLITTPTVK